MRALPIHAAVLVMFGIGSAVAGAAVAQVVGSRTLPERYTPGAPAEVQLDLTIDGGPKPNGVIVVETLPPGWALESATPGQSSFNPTTGEARWVFFGSQLNGSDMDIRYTAVPPAQPDGQSRFAGSILFNDQAGNPQIVPIAGNAATSAVTAAASNPAARDNGGSGCAVVQGQRVEHSGVLGLAVLPALFLWKRRRGR